MYEPSSRELASTRVIQDEMQCLNYEGVHFKRLALELYIEIVNDMLRQVIVNVERISSVSPIWFDRV